MSDFTFGSITRSKPFLCPHKRGSKDVVTVVQRLFFFLFFSPSKSSHFNRNLNDLEFCVMVKAAWFESDFYGSVYTWYSDPF